MKNDLERMKDFLSRLANDGWTRDEALEKKVCVKCKQTPRFKTQAGRREYPISGLCEYCWDEIFKDDK